MTSLMLSRLDETAEGRTLAEDLLDASGQKLVNAGTVLTKSLIDSLGRRGIAEALLLDADGGDVAPSENKKSREEIQQRIEHLFRRALRDGEVHPLLHLLLRYRLGNFS